MKYRNKDINRLLGLVRLALPIHLTLIFLASFAGLWFDLSPRQHHGYNSTEPARYIFLGAPQKINGHGELHYD